MLYCIVFEAGEREWRYGVAEGLEGRLLPAVSLQAPGEQVILLNCANPLDSETSELVCWNIDALESRINVDEYVMHDTWWWAIICTEVYSDQSKMSVSVVGAKLWNEVDSNLWNAKTILLLKKNWNGVHYPHITWLVEYVGIFRFFVVMKTWFFFIRYVIWIIIHAWLVYPLIWPNLCPRLQMELASAEKFLLKGTSFLRLQGQELE